jgi:phage baseplate assembly protein W
MSPAALAANPTIAVAAPCAYEPRIQLKRMSRVPDTRGQRALVLGWYSTVVVGVLLPPPPSRLNRDVDRLQRCE